jgi:cytochrome c biogenesis protein CcdA
MALQTFEVFTFIKPTYLQTKNQKKGYLGAFMTGILAGFFSSPCATPVLVAILALVSNSSIWWGALLLFLYAVGNSILVIIVGTFMGTATKITKSKQYGRISNFIKYLLGMVILILGLYLLYLGF